MHVVKMPESVPFKHSDIAGMILENEFNGKKCVIAQECNDDRWPDLVAVKFLDDNSSPYKNAFRVHKSWIEEIKEESAFEKWCLKDHIQSASIVESFRECWQASEENRDLLYKNFIDLYEDFLHQDFELMGYNTANNKSKEILRSLSKINKALKSNGGNGGNA